MNCARQNRPPVKLTQRRRYFETQTQDATGVCVFQVPTIHLKKKACIMMLPTFIYIYIYIFLTDSDLVLQRLVAVFYSGGEVRLCCITVDLPIRRKWVSCFF